MNQLSQRYDIVSLSKNMSGLQEYGPIGLRIRDNIINLWKKVMIETSLLGDIHLIETPQMMDASIFKRSGHLDRFKDPIVIDEDGNQFRLDHLIEEQQPNIRFDSQNLNQIKSIFEGLGIKLPSEKEAKEYKLKDLMFKVGKSYLRPEIAQGIFMFYEKFSSDVKSLPFGLAQIGKSFRNEISTKSFTRLKEFNQAEIEFFIDPDRKDYDIKTFDFSEGILFLFSDHTEVITQSETLTKKINPVMAYFICKINHFIKLCGFKKDTYRFRQHGKDELSHYSSDCWDLEIYVDDKWLECIGLAYRGSYDLNCHKLSPISISCDEYNFVEETLKVNKKNISIEFKKDTKDVLDAIEENKDMVISKLNDNCTEIEINNFKLKKDYFTVVRKNKKLRERKVMPHVVEPSFGIDRIFYAIISNLTKKVNSKNILSLNTNIAPFNFAVFKIFNKKELDDSYNEVLNKMYNRDLTIFKDKSGTSLGKKYLRSDSIGVPYAITIDMETPNSNKVTIRERDTTFQIYVPIQVISSFCKDLLFNPKLFHNVIEGNLEF